MILKKNSDEKSFITDQNKLNSKLRNITAVSIDTQWNLWSWAVSNHAFWTAF